MGRKIAQGARLSTLSQLFRKPGPLLRARIASFLGRGTPNEERLARFDLDVSEMRIRKARFSFRELLGYYREELLPVLSDVSYITMTDIDERRNAIVIGVATRDRVAEMSGRVEKLPIPSEAVEVVQYDAVSPETRRPRVLPPAMAAPNLKGVLRPVPGGAEIVAWWDFLGVPCTLGFNLRAWVGDTLGSSRYFVTNSHCSGDSDYDMGIVRPSHATQPQGNQFIGEEWVDPSFYTYSQSTTCVQGRLCRNSDVALFKYTNALDSDHGNIALPMVGGALSFTVMTRVTGVVAPTVGYPIHMVGKNSGHTTGTVTRLCADFPLSTSSNPRSIWFLCQGVATNSSQHGDSGAPMFELMGDGSQAWAVGLHWGSAGVFSPMYAVLGELFDAMPSNGLLDATADAPPPGPTSTISGRTLVRPNVPCIWNATAAGGVAPLAYTWRKNGSQIAQGTLTVTTTFASSGTIEFRVTDVFGRTSTSALSVSVSPSTSVCLY